MTQKEFITPDKFRCVAEWNLYDGYGVRFINDDYVNKRKETIEFYELDDRKAVIDMIKQYGFKRFDFNIVTEEEYVDEIRDTVHHINNITEDEFDLFIDMANHDDALTEWERDEWETRREKEEE